MRSVVSLEIRTRPQGHHHRLRHRQSHHLQTALSALYHLHHCCLIRTLNIRPALLATLQGPNAELLTTGPGPDSSSRTHSSCRNKTAHVDRSPPRPPPPPFNSGSMSLTILDSSQKWYHAVSVLLCLAYFTVLHMHPRCHERQGFLLVREFYF